jgi:hypothetical protein
MNNTVEHNGIKYTRDERGLWFQGFHCIRAISICQQLENKWMNQNNLKPASGPTTRPLTRKDIEDAIDIGFGQDYEFYMEKSVEAVVQLLGERGIRVNEKEL